MTKRKTEMADGVRLENASWRTWAQQRNNLKTVNPESLNWSVLFSAPWFGLDVDVCMPK
jgi:hypothetical protein